MKITCLKDLALEARNMATKTVIAVVEAQDEHTLESVVKATHDELMIPVLIGNTKKIKTLLSQYGAEPSAFKIVESAGADESLGAAVELINNGAATALMKGKLDSGQFIKVVVKKQNNLTDGGTLSVCGLFETPSYNKLFAVSDMALNTYPDLNTKKTVIKNAVRLLHSLGIDTPGWLCCLPLKSSTPKCRTLSTVPH